MYSIQHTYVIYVDYTDKIHVEPMYSMLRFRLLQCTGSSFTQRICQMQELTAGPSSQLQTFHRSSFSCCCYRYYCCYHFVSAGAVTAAKHGLVPSYEVSCLIYLLILKVYRLPFNVPNSNPMYRFVCNRGTSNVTCWSLRTRESSLNPKKKHEKRSSSANPTSAAMVTAVAVIEAAAD